MELTHSTNLAVFINANKSIYDLGLKEGKLYDFSGERKLIYKIALFAKDLFLLILFRFTQNSYFKPNNEIINFVKQNIVNITELTEDEINLQPTWINKMMGLQEISEVVGNAKNRVSEKVDLALKQIYSKANLLTQYDPTRPARLIEVRLCFDNEGNVTMRNSGNYDLRIVLSLGDYQKNPPEIQNDQTVKRAVIRGVVEALYQNEGKSFKLNSEKLKHEQECKEGKSKILPLHDGQFKEKAVQMSSKRIIFVEANL